MPLRMHHAHANRHPSLLASTLLVGLLAGCGEVAPAPDGAFEETRSARARITTPAVADADRAAFAQGQLRFAVDAYRFMAAEAGNFVYSPHSIQSALAMAWAGARGSTESQMSAALRFGLPQDRLHAAFNALDQGLASRAARPVSTGRRFQLRVSNALFGQDGFGILPGYLDTLAESYGAGVKRLDIAADPDAARRRINAWVGEQTERRIPELLGPGSVSGLTRLVLTNAVYFNASWDQPFSPAATAPAPWRAPDTAPRMVPMMHRTDALSYGEGEGWQAVEIPYVGGEVAMLLVLPAEGRMGDFERGLTPERVDAITRGLGTRMVQLTVPTFSFRKNTSLKALLRGLGMSDAFEPGAADFSGIDGRRDLFVQDVVHEGFIGVDERGTEAAAATAVNFGTTAVPQPATFQADRPFIFAIRDRVSGSLLFLGRVVAP